MIHSSANKIKIVSGFQPIDQELLRSEMLFLAGFGRQKHIWVLGRLLESPQVASEYQFSSGVLNCPRELISLASFFLLRCFQSILEQASNYFHNKLHRIFGLMNFRKFGA